MGFGQCYAIFIIDTNSASNCYSTSIICICSEQHLNVDISGSVAENWGDF